MEPSTLDLWIAVSAVLVTLITWGITQLPARFTALHKRAIAAVSSGVLALGGVFYQGNLDPADLGRTWLVIFMAATAFYVVIAKGIIESAPVQAALPRALRK